MSSDFWVIREFLCAERQGPGGSRSRVVVTARPASVPRRRCSPLMQQRACSAARRSTLYELVRSRGFPTSASVIALAGHARGPR